MKLIPKYSYEFNQVLNEGFNETEQVKNFASLITDKDRFLAMMQSLEKNVKLMESTLGHKLPKEIEFYVVRAEKFKSFSEPIVIEYSILPEEMLMFLIKEIVKTSVEGRFMDEVMREQYVNSFVSHIVINGDFKGIDFVKYANNLHEESKKLHSNYSFKDIDFKKKTMKEHIESHFEE
jgi:phosphate starvation-inducible protein PhoH